MKNSTIAFEKLPDRTTEHGVRSHSFKNVKTKAEVEEQVLLKNQSQGERTDFWKSWVRERDYLYQRCLTCMGGNHEDAQEALSRATLKAWEKWQVYAGKITNPKAWLTRLTYNLCMDMHRERTRGARGIESIENFAVTEDEYVASSVSSPESAVLDRERDAYICRAIDALPANLRTPFILRYYQEMSYSEIAQKLACSSDQVRKQVYQARTTLQKQLHKYFSGWDDSSCFFDQKDEMIAPTASLETPINEGFTPESITYKVSATCLEVLSRTSYSSLSPLGWR